MTDAGAASDVDAGVGSDAARDAGAASDAARDAGVESHAARDAGVALGADIVPDVATDADVRVLAAGHVEASAAECAMVVFVCLQVFMKSIIA